MLIGREPEGGFKNGLPQKPLNGLSKQILKSFTKMPSSISDKKKHIPLSVPVMGENEWKYVKECLDTGWVSSVGSYVDLFEKTVADYLGTKYAIATINGTSALHVSLIACGVQPDDEVIVPSLTFIAPANAVRYCGANPVFIDCTQDTLCLDTERVAEFITNKCIQGSDGYSYNKRTKKRVKAVIPVHVFGHPTNMDDLAAICGEHSIDIIEDATESLGSEYKGQKAGSIGKVGCLSFNGNKIITTGGGGMVVTNDENIAANIRHLITQAKCDTFEYDHDEIGFNYRLTNIQAAIGVAQMESLEKYIHIKRENAGLYERLLSTNDCIEFLKEKKWAMNNYWFYTIKVSKNHKCPLIEHLLSNNIQVRPVWKLIHTLPMYRNFQNFTIENAVEAYDSCINLPCSVSLQEHEILSITNCINDYFANV